MFLFKELLYASTVLLNNDRHFCWLNVMSFLSHPLHFTVTVPLYFLFFVIFCELVSPTVQLL